MKKIILLIFLVLGYWNVFSQNKSEILKKAEPNMTFEKKPSIISIPFDLSINDLEKQINEGLPDLIFEDNSFEGDDLKIKVWRKGNLVFTNNHDGILTYEVPLKVWASKKTTILGISHEPSTDFEVKIKFSSQFSINSDYGLETKTKGLGYTWITRPSIKVGFIDVPIAPIIGKVLTSNFELFSLQIDETIKEGFSLKPYIIDAWNMAKQPFQVSKEYNTWVMADPVEVYMMPLRSAGRSVRSTLGIKLFLETYVGTPQTKVLSVSDVPKLRRVEFIPEEFEIQLLNVISFEEANVIAKRMFIGETFEFRKGRYKITVNDLNIQGADQDQLVIDLNTQGSFNGKLTVVGKPYYNAEKEMVMLENVNLDVKTRNFLHRSAGWLLRSTLTKNIENEFGIPVTDIIEYSRDSVTETINSEFSPGIKMKGRVLSIIPDKVMMTDEGMIALVNASARVQLIIAGLE